ncbi:MAG: phosphatase PAP2 family protein [Clostridiales bacterium]|nr:phosphatase PAP2 family protein [Clostridiales bacterium]
MDKNKKMKNSNFIDACSHAIDGLIYATTTQNNIKKQLFIAVCVLILSLFYKLETTHFLCLTFAVFLVIFAEMVNTAIETIVDLITQEYNIKAKIAKDIGAGAVLLMSINSVIVAYFIFFNETEISNISQIIFRSMVTSPKHLIFTSIILIGITILAFKAFGSRKVYKDKENVDFEKKRFMPSGQTALAFGILTTIWLTTRNILIFILSLMLSLMIFENRLINKKHSLAESIFSLFMGILVVLLVFGLTLL